MTAVASGSRAQRWSGWPQLFFHQAGWWACVIWMGWLGPAAMLAFLIAHLVMTRQRLAHELTIITVAMLIGIVLDSSLALVGAVSYVGDLKVWASPLWLAAIWAGFGATLMHSQSLLVRTRRLALVTGAFGGPAAYWGGERLERLTVHSESGWVAVSLGWTLALLVLYGFTTRLRTR